MKFIFTIIINRSICPFDYILLTYYTDIINSKYKDQILNPNTVLVKIDATDGKTLWEKLSEFTFKGVVLLNRQTIMLNDTAWTMLTPSAQPISIPSAIAKVDSNGQLVSAFYVMNNNINDSSSGYILQVFDFLLNPDGSFVLCARIISNSSDFISSTPFNYDLSYYKLDPNRDIVWGTTLDYFGGNDMNSQMIVDGDYIYAGITTSF